MQKKRKQHETSQQAVKEPRKQTPTFLLVLPLQVTRGQAARLRAHLEAGRQFYNAILSEGNQRMREQYGFSEYGLHEAAKVLRVSWIADHLDAVLAQTLASRAYHALNRVCVGEPAASASRAGDGACAVWRINATIPDCALCSSNQKKATRAT